MSERKSVAVRDRHPMSVMWLALPQKQRKFSVLTMAVGVMFLAFNLILTGTSSDLNKNWLFVTFGLFVAVAFLPGTWVRRGEEYFEQKFWEYPIAVSLVFAPWYMVASAMSMAVALLAVRIFVVAPEKRLRVPVDFAAVCVAATVGCAVATIYEPLTYPVGCVVLVVVHDLIMFCYDDSRGGRTYAVQAWEGTWAKRLAITVVVSVVATGLVYLVGPQREFLLLAPVSVLVVSWFVQYRNGAAEEKAVWAELQRVTGRFVAQTDDSLLAQQALKTGLTLFNARHGLVTLYADGHEPAIQWSLRAGPHQRIQTEVFAAGLSPEPPVLPMSNQKVQLLTLGQAPIGWMLLEWDPEAPVRSSRDSLTTTYGHVVASSLANTLATKKERTRRMQKQREAEEDPLTGMGNRARLALRGPAALAESADVGSVAALILLDLDGFKRINDTLGHAAGDQVLVEVARRIKDTVRQSDLAIRLGGDEFAILARELRWPADADAMASKIVRALVPPVEVEGLQLSVETSIGIAVSPDDADNVDDLLKRADIALYKSKAGGRGLVTRYSADIDFASTDSLRLATDLRRAIAAQDELVLHYQPQIDLASERVIGVEALVRWQHPTEGLLYPDRFVHLAEESNLIHSFTTAILHRAIAGRKEMRKVLPHGTVSVNLSAHNLLDQSLPGEVASLLGQYDVKPNELVLEVTETAAAGDTAAANRVLSSLVALGCKVAMDDFGTGYATLDTLRSGAPNITEIKMDREFVKDVAQNERSRKVAKAIIDIAHAMDCDMVAEGIEDVETLQVLRDLGCDHAQGYYWMRPAPLSEVMDWIGSHTHRLRQSAGPEGSTR